MRGDVQHMEIERAARVLRAGGLVAFPTETVYGLGADASSPAAVRRIFATKQRPPTHPLIVHLPDAEMLAAWAAEVPAGARALAASFWPGPLTIVLRRGAAVIDEVTGGLPTVALRVPDHPVARALLSCFGGGIAAPSANRFGAVSPTTAAHVHIELGDAIDRDGIVVLDGGPCAVGLESTIVDLSRGDDDPLLLRPGAVTREQLAAVLGRAVPDGGAAAPASPGRLLSHYAPRATVHVVPREQLDATVAAHTGVRVGVLRHGPGAHPPRWHELDDRIEVELGDDAAFAHDLYAVLRALDERGCDVIVATSPDPVGLGLAIADRLHKAAGPRG